jgi:hypothetical protein
LGEEEGSTRRLLCQNEELYGLFLPKDITRVMKSRMMRLAARVTGNGETEASIECWWRKRPTGKSRLRWDDNIKVDFKEI